MWTAPNVIPHIVLFPVTKSHSGYICMLTLPPEITSTAPQPVPDFVLSSDTSTDYFEEEKSHNGYFGR